VALLAVTVLVAGSGLAALPSAGNEQCPTPDVPGLPADEALAPDIDTVTPLLPFGTRCEAVTADGRRSVFARHAPGTAAFVAWLVVTAVLLRAAWRRRERAAARGVAAATAVLGLLGLLWHLTGEFPAAVMGVVVLGLPLVLAVDRGLWPGPREDGAGAALALALLLPLVVVLAWTPPAFLELPVPGLAAGLLAGALLAAGIARVATSARPAPPGTPLSSRR
jgi:hypothetical protein